MVMGLAIYTPLAIAGAIFFVAHNVLVKTNLFFISGLVSKKYGSYKLKELGGVYKAFPFLALLFAISAFSLTGIPPLSGFWGKLVLATAGFSASQWLPITITAISLGVSLLTLFSMTKIWNEVFWKPLPLEIKNNNNEVNTIKDFVKHYPGMMASTILLTILILSMGFFPNHIIESCLEAAKGLIDGKAYIQGVLGL
jgi:multicomponent Na+:H+ antiporter subunit D